MPAAPTTSGSGTAQRPRLSRELNGAFGDFGTFLPYVTGVLTVGGLGAGGVLSGFGLMLVACGAFYAIPIAVQPMKAVTAALLTSGLSPSEVATAGVLTGLALLILGLSGAVGWLARAIPQSVTTGLQLGLGLSMCWLGAELAMAEPLIGGLTLAMLVIAARVTMLPLLPLVVLAAAGGGIMLSDGAILADGGLGLSLPRLVTPTLDSLWHVLESAVAPQIALTLTNAIIVTAAVSQSLYGSRAGRANERNLALSTGLGNLLLAPFGALPMCHGAGGVAAQARFGARTGLAPIMLGMLLLILGLFAADAAGALLSAIPLPAAGALLIIAGFDLAMSRRLIDARPNCWPAILCTAALTLILNPVAGLAAGIAVESIRSAAKRHRAKSGDCR